MTDQPILPPLRKAFVALIVTNGLIGVADLAVACLVIFHSFVFAVLSSIVSVIPFLEKPVSIVHNLFLALSAQSQTLVLFYFLSHGIIKLFLCWALLKKKLWAYPLAIVFFALFSAYQLIAVIQTGTLFDGLLLAFNVIVLWMVVREYQSVRRLLKA